MIVTCPSPLKLSDVKVTRLTDEVIPRTTVFYQSNKSQPSFEIPLAHCVLPNVYTYPSYQYPCQKKKNQELNKGKTWKFYITSQFLKRYAVQWMILNK